MHLNRGLERIFSPVRVSKNYKYEVESSEQEMSHYYLKRWNMVVMYFFLSSLKV